MLKNHKKSKKGVSLMIGYVLLVSLAVIMGGIMYAWMKSYVPKDALDCPEGTSLIIKSYEYNCTSNIIRILIKNNGRFDVGGFFIHASNNSDITLPTIDISARANESFGGYKYQNSIIFNATNDNVFKPGDEIEITFDKDLTEIGVIYYIQIIPTRWQSQENILRYVSCGKVSTVKEDISCTS